MLSSIWIYVSSVFHHMSLDSSCFSFMSHSFFIPIMIVDGTPMPFAGVGYVVTSNLSLFNIYHTFKLTLNFAYIGQLCDSRNLVTFLIVLCKICSLRSCLGQAIGRGGLHVLEELKVLATASVAIFGLSFHLSPSSSSFYL